MVLAKESKARLMERAQEQIDYMYMEFWGNTVDSAICTEHYDERNRI